MSSKDDDDEYENENEDEDETMSQNEKNEIMKGKKWYFRWNNWQIKIIWRANGIVKKIRTSKRILALMKKYDIDEKIFEQIFGHTLIELADKLINTTNKEENWIIVKNINKNKKNLYEQDETDPFHHWMI